MTIRCSASTSVSAVATKPTASLRSRAATAISKGLRMIRVHGERRQLAALDARQMADLGLTETQRRDELKRPFWDID